MKAKFLLPVIIVLAGIGSANAQLRNRTQHQRQRIHQGIRSGELTRAEAANIRSDQREIRSDVKLAKADGTVSAPEKKIIARERNRESRKIYRKKHNRRERI